MTRYRLTESEQQLRDDAAAIGVDVAELEVAAVVARVLTDDRSPLTYELLQEAYDRITTLNGGIEPQQLAVSPRTLAEIKSLFQPQQRVNVPLANGFNALQFFNSAVIVRDAAWDNSISWKGVNGFGALRFR